MSYERGSRFHQNIGYEYVPRNLLINPGFEIWQRGAGPFTIDGTGTADEWWIDSQPGIPSVNRESSVVSVGNYSLRCNYNFSLSTSTVYIKQSLENWKSLQGLTLTFSVWIKSSKIAYIRLRDNTGASGTDEGVTAIYLGSNNWERLTVVKAIRTGLVSPPNPANWYPHDFPVQVEVSTNAAVVGTGAGLFYVDGATLVVGNFPGGVPFVPSSPALDWRRCQRFYEYGSGFIGTAETPSATGAATLYWFFPFRVRKYSAPTLTSSFTAGGGDFAGTTLGGANASVEGVNISIINLGPGPSSDPGGTYSWEAEVP